MQGHDQVSFWTLLRIVFCSADIIMKVGRLGFVRESSLLHWGPVIEMSDNLLGFKKTFGTPFCLWPSNSRRLSLEEPTHLESPLTWKAHSQGKPTHRNSPQNCWQWRPIPSHNPHKRPLPSVARSHAPKTATSFHDKTWEFVVSKRRPWRRMLLLMPIQTAHRIT